MTPECMQMGLHVRKIETAADVERLRFIRNTCRMGFAHDNNKISHVAQRAWWVVMKDRVKAWLYFSDADELLGYGLVRQTEDGRWWNSVAVLPWFAGEGYGSAITADLLTRHDGPIWAEARADNVPAYHMHRESDWELLGVTDGLALFKTKERVIA